MFQIKSSFRKSSSRERSSDLTILSGVPSFKSTQKNPKRVRYKNHDNVKLFQQFMHARNFALKSQLAKSVVKSGSVNSSNAVLSNLSNGGIGKSVKFQTEAIPASFSHSGFAQPSSTTSAYSNFQKLATGQNIQAGGCNQTPQQTVRYSPATANAVPGLVQRTETRLYTRTPVPTLGTSAQGSETEYWSLFTSSGRRKKSYSSSGIRPASTWSVRASYPMNREDAQSVQSEMASFPCSQTPANSSSNNNSFFTFDSLNSIENRPIRPLPSLVASIQPPTPSSGNSTPVSNWNVNEPVGVVQSNWVSRETLKGEAITKQYSIAQLLDILTGHSVPPTSEIAARVFNPEESTITDTFEQNSILNEGDQQKPVGRKKGKDKPKKKRTPKPLQEINHEWIALRNNNFLTYDKDDDNESIYFKKPPTPQAATVNEKKKSVTFLTDQNNNVAVETFLFDRFTQEQNNSPLILSFDNNKENKSQQNDFEELFPLSVSTFTPKLERNMDARGNFNGSYRQNLVPNDFEELFPLPVSTSTPKPQRNMDVRGQFNGSYRQNLVPYEYDFGEENSQNSQRTCFPFSLKEESGKESLLHSEANSGKQNDLFF